LLEAYRKDLHKHYLTVMEESWTNNSEEMVAIKKAAQLIAPSKRVVVLSGAGLSAASGIGTFRGASNSLWAGVKGTIAMAYFGTPIGWRWTPALSWKLYVKEFYQEIAKASPNEGHRALAELQKMKPGKVTIITQNVDGLHQSGGSPAESVVELHGTVRKHICIKERHPNELIAEAFDGQRVPRCSQEGCSSYLRPDAVLFGEELNTQDWTRSVGAVSSLQEGDVFLIVGTSGVVEPAASLPRLAHSHGSRICRRNTSKSNKCL